MPFELLHWSSALKLSLLVEGSCVGTHSEAYGNHLAAVPSSKACLFEASTRVTEAVSTIQSNSARLISHLDLHVSHRASWIKAFSLEEEFTGLFVT